MSSRGILSLGCLLAAVFFLGAPMLRGDDTAAPFVAGFDRFARHGDITPRVAGELLLTELNCTACHTTDDKRLAPKLGPKLGGVGNRLERDWLREFLSSPHSVKPGTTMPDVLQQLPAKQRDSAARALAAFLATQQTAFPVVRGTGRVPVPHEFWNRGDVEQGRRLYHQVGCVACHEPDGEFEAGPRAASQLDKLLEQLDPEELAEMGLAAAARPVNSVPHGDLPAKYTHRALTFFLLDPAATRAGGRMPSLKLMPVEAANITAYLLRDKKRSTPPSDDSPVLDAALVETGRRLFSELKCSACHTADGVEKPQGAKPLSTLNADADNSCLDATSGEAPLPHFSLDHPQRSSLREAIGALSEASAATPTTGGQLELQLLQLNCYGCHERDGRGGVGRRRGAYFETIDHIDLGDEGRLPPPLGGVGRKLKTAWIKKVLAGTGDVRPHMRARMPLFPAASVSSLPALLAKTDVPAKASEAELFGAPSDAGSLAEAGRVLLDTGCVQCHPTRGDSLPSVVGIDLAGIPGRVHPQWFHDFLLNPAALKPRTRMPTFFPNGKSANPDVLHGDVEQQIAAIWTYIKEIEKHPLPEKLELARSQNFELVPDDRPILLRTFMEQAGRHAIAVGFPAKTHFAFDAEQVRPAVAWRGRFLDAHGTWFVRAAPPAKPLGDRPVSFPSGGPLAMLEDARQPWPETSGEEAGYRFLGYRLDRGGVPTFLYRAGGFHVEERLQAIADGGLRRKLHIKAPMAVDRPQLWLRLNAGRRLRRDRAGAYTNEDGMTTTVSESLARTATLREGDVSDWILPVVLEDGEATIEVEYRW
ncbi:MAG: c-type cytochrome [Pirellulaceae bacterium]